MNETLARQIVTARSSGNCETCGRTADDWAHRVARSGGGLWTPSNGLHQCRSCHKWAHFNPTAAEITGWRVLSGEHPADVPAWLQSPYLIGWHILGEDGSYTPLWGRDDKPDLPPWVTTICRIAAGKSQR